VGGVDNELVADRVKGGGGLDAADVGTMPELSQGEAAAELERRRAGEEVLAVVVGAKTGNGAHEEAELDANQGGKGVVVAGEGVTILVESVPLGRRQSKGVCGDEPPPPEPGSRPAPAPLASVTPWWRCSQAGTAGLTADTETSRREREARRRK